MRSATVTIGVLLFTAVAVAKEPNLPTLRRKLLEAHTEKQVAQALDALQERIGRRNFFADHGAFGDWLATIPDGRDKHVRVLERRGWAYMMARRGSDGIPPLEAAKAQDPGSGLIRAYLGECLRQAGRFLEASEMLATAARCGLREAYLPEGVMQSATALRKLRPAKNAKGLPDYVRAFGLYLAVRPDELTLRQTLAVWLLADMEAYEKPSTVRGALWARTAGSHLLEVADATSTMARDLRKAGVLVGAQNDPRAKALAFELLSWAVRRSHVPQLDKHLEPEALLDLAALALEQERYALAKRCLSDRLALGPSTRAMRLGRLLPADMDVR